MHGISNREENALFYGAVMMRGTGETTNGGAVESTMRGNSAFRWWLLGLGLCAGVVTLCVAYVDRPVADFVYEHLSHKDVYRTLTQLPDPLQWVVMLGLALLLAAGCRAIAGRRLSSWTDTPLVCCWSLVWASTATVALKYTFGRTWPGAYTHYRVYGFHPFHGGEGYESFPSGITAGAASILAVLWILMPRLRVLWGLGLAAVAFGLVATNSHFLGDVIGGGFLGVTTGWMSVALWRRAA
jgi:membrane-associated phospholipid phosphatase